MPDIQGVAELSAKLRRRISNIMAQCRINCLVGYTASYAIIVHENLEAFHSNGQAKFLEQPARENAQKYATIIVTSAEQGLPLPQCLLMAGLELQRDSQLLVPVDTGNLKGSAFTRLEAV